MVTTRLALTRARHPLDHPRLARHGGRTTGPCRATHEPHSTTLPRQTPTLLGTWRPSSCAMRVLSGAISSIPSTTSSSALAAPERPWLCASSTTARWRVATKVSDFVGVYAHVSRVSAIFHALFADREENADEPLIRQFPAGLRGLPCARNRARPLRPGGWGRSVGPTGLQRCVSPSWRV